MLEVPTASIFITPVDIRKRYGHFDPNVFTRWQLSGKVEKIRNGLYLNAAFELRGDWDSYLIACKIYPPAYVSLASALRFYNFIPETVYHHTCITTRKTASFTHRGVNYRFRKMKPELFFGYFSNEWRGEVFNIASPEKTMIDLAYFEPMFSDPGWLEEMRFDAEEMKEMLDWDRMFRYVQLMGSKEVEHRILTLRSVYQL